MLFKLTILTTLLLILGVQATPVKPIPRQVVVDPAPPSDPSSTTITDPGVTQSIPGGPASGTTTAAPEGPTDSAPGNPASPSDGNGTAETGTNPTGGNADLTVVKFAALAESLESTFYDQALKKFSAQSFAEAGFTDGQAIFDSISVVLKDEQTHLKTLQDVATTLGGSTSDVDSCTFNFDSALTDVSTFLATARTLEFVGVDAYIGGTTLISDKSLLVSAAEIATVEAKHHAMLNLLNGATTIASPFDMVLTPEQVLSVAAPFISGGCDPVAALGLTPTPALSLTNTGPLTPGTTVTFGGAGLDGKDTSILFCNMIVGGATEALVFPVPQCVVPDGLDGPVHIFVTNSGTPLSANIVSQDASIIVAGPVIGFVDTIPNTISSLLKGNGSSQVQLSSGNESPGEGGKKVIITKITVTKTRNGLGIHQPVDGGHGGAVPLGWY